MVQFDKDFIQAHEEEYKDLLQQALVIYQEALKKGEPRDAALKLAQDFMRTHPFVDPVQQGD